MIKIAIFFCTLFTNIHGNACTAFVKIQISFLNQCSWASADFFPVEGKIFQGGGQKHTIFLKNTKKDTIFLKKKSRKTYYFVFWLARGGGKCPPADAHVSVAQPMSRELFLSVSPNTLTFPTSSYSLVQ